jgi:hypothetical protein
MNETTEIQKTFPIGDCVYVKFRDPSGGTDWYEPYFVSKITAALVYVDEFMGKSFRLQRRSLEARGFFTHHSAGLVFRTELPEDYKRKTLGYLMAKEPREVLGLGDTFTPEQLKQAYRAAVIKAHPDKHGGTHDEFIKVQAAYARLSQGNSLPEIIKFAKNYNQQKP